MASCPAVRALVSVGIETPAGKMAVGKTQPSRRSGERRDRDPGCRDGCRHESIGIKTAAVEMAVGKMPRSRRSGERRDRDTGC